MDAKRARERYLRSRFGLSLEDYDALVAAQDGGCAICGRPVADCRGGPLVVDHEHRSGLIRGLLCTLHNRMITRELEEWGVSLVSYLMHPPAVQVLGERYAPHRPRKRKRRKRTAEEGP